MSSPSLPLPSPDDFSLPVAQSNKPFRKSRKPKKDRKERIDLSSPSVTTLRTARRLTAASLRRDLRRHRPIKRVRKRRSGTQDVVTTPPPALVGIIGDGVQSGSGAGSVSVSVRGVMRSIIGSFGIRVRRGLDGVVAGPVSVLTGSGRGKKSRRFCFFVAGSSSCNDLLGLIDLSKCVDLVILCVNVQRGLTLRQFEFLNLLKNAGFVQVWTILSNLQSVQTKSRVNSVVKSLRKRIWKEVLPGSPVFRFGALGEWDARRGVYGPMTAEVQRLKRNLMRFKRRPVIWRTSHPFVLVDRWQKKDADGAAGGKEVVFSGFIRGNVWKVGPCEAVMIPGIGTFRNVEVSLVPDPMFSRIQAGRRGRRLEGRNRALSIYAPMSSHLMNEELFVGSASVAAAAGAGGGTGGTGGTGGRRMVGGLEPQRQDGMSGGGEGWILRIPKVVRDEKEAELMQDLTAVSASASASASGPSSSGLELVRGVGMGVAAPVPVPVPVPGNGPRTQAPDMMQQILSKKPSSFIRGPASSSSLYDLIYGGQRNLQDTSDVSFLEMESSDLQHDWDRPDVVELIRHKFIPCREAIREKPTPTESESEDEADDEFDDEFGLSDDETEGGGVPFAAGSAVGGGGDRLGQGEDEEEGEVDLLDSDSEALDADAEDAEDDDDDNDLSALFPETGYIDDQIENDAFDGLEMSERLAVEGIPVGAYVHIRVRDFPLADFEHSWDPHQPLLLCYCKPEETRMGLIRLRMKKHRWFPREVLKNRDPLIVSVGWHRFQTVPTFFVADGTVRLRMLKYTPLHTFCMAVCYGPWCVQNSGVVCIQDPKSPEFRCSATGFVMEMCDTMVIKKKLKLVGSLKASSIRRENRTKNCVVTGMFSSDIEVSRFCGARLHCVSGIRGILKRPLGRDGDFRASFEAPVLKSDVVMLRTWVDVKIPRLFNPLLNHLTENLILMRTNAQLRRVRGIELEATPDGSQQVLASDGTVDRNVQYHDNRFRLKGKLNLELPFREQAKEVVTQPAFDETFRLQGLEQDYLSNKERQRINFVKKLEVMNDQVDRERNIASFRAKKRKLKRDISEERARKRRRVQKKKAYYRRKKFS